MPTTSFLDSWIPAALDRALWIIAHDEEKRLEKWVRLCSDVRWQEYQ
jgi:hypothetical protein